jgi:hypothetical protein
MLGSAPDRMIRCSSRRSWCVRSAQAGLLVGCPDEFAYIKGSVTADDLRGLSETSKPISQSGYVGN